MAYGTKIEYQTMRLENGVSYDLDLTAVYHSKSQNPKFPADQLQLRGRSGGAAVKVYVPLDCLDMLTQLGAVEHPVPGNNDNYGEQKYVVRGKPALSLIREKNGWVEIGPQGSMPEASAVPKAPVAAQKPTGATKPAPTAPTRPLVPPPAISDPWKEMGGLYARCVLMATETWKQAGMVLTGPELVAAAAALFIEANHKGLRVEEPKPKTVAKVATPRNAPIPNQDAEDAPPSWVTDGPDPEDPE